MIFYDLPDDIVTGKRSVGLLKKSGADAIVSLKGFPPNTETMIMKHVESGACLYRVIDSNTIATSTLDMLLFGLNKMHELGAKPWQCVLLVDDHRKLQSYDDMVSKVTAWSDHGGTSVSTYGNPYTYYLSKRDSTFAETLKSRTILVPSFFPRKMIEVERDWTLTLATFPGVGLHGAKVIREMITSRGLGDDLLTALWFLTDIEELENTKDKNWREVREKARKWLGLPDHLNIDIGIREK